MIKLRFLKDFSFTFFTKFSLQVLSFVISLFIIKEMGEIERGRYVLLLSYAQIGVQLLSFGLQSSNTYFIAKNPSIEQKANTNSFFLSVASAIFSYVLLSLISYFNLIVLTGFEACVISMTIGAMLFTTFTTGILIGFKRYGLVNVLDIVSRTIACILLFFLVYSGVKDHLFYLVVGLFSLFLWILFFLKFYGFSIGKADFQFFLDSLRYGSRGYVSSFMFLLVFKIDTLMISYYLGEKSLGVFSFSISVFDAVLVLPAIFGQILFSEWSSLNNRKIIFRSYFRALNIVFIFVFCIVLLSSLMLPYFVSSFFGDKFEFAGQYSSLLLIAGIFMGANVITMNYLASLGMPSAVVVIPTVGLLINFWLNTIFIPRYGLFGVCYSSIISYFSIFICGLYFSLYRSDELSSLKSSSSYDLVSILDNFDVSYDNKRLANMEILVVAFADKMNFSRSVGDPGFDYVRAEMGDNPSLCNEILTKLNSLKKEYDIIVCLNSLDMLAQTKREDFFRIISSKLKIDGILHLSARNDFGVQRLQSFVSRNSCLKSLWISRLKKKLEYIGKIKFLGPESFSKMDLEKLAHESNLEIFETHGYQMFDDSISRFMPEFHLLTKINFVYGKSFPFLASKQKFSLRLKS